MTLFLMTYFLLGACFGMFITSYWYLRTLKKLKEELEEFERNQADDLDMICKQLGKKTQFERKTK